MPPISSRTKADVLLDLEGFKYIAVEGLDPRHGSTGEGYDCSDVHQDDDYDQYLDAGHAKESKLTKS